MTLTDSSVPGPKKQVYISGALHGNERIGPNAVYYFLEYYLSKLEQEDGYIEREVMKNVEVILTPMTNAPGYFHNEREERVSSHVR